MQQTGLSTSMQNIKETIRSIRGKKSATAESEPEEINLDKRVAEITRNV
jgi:hypothetical protein